MSELNVYSEDGSQLLQSYTIRGSVILEQTFESEIITINDKQDFTIPDEHKEISDFEIQFHGKTETTLSDETNSASRTAAGASSFRQICSAADRMQGRECVDYDWVDMFTASTFGTTVHKEGYRIGDTHNTNSPITKRLPSDGYEVNSGRIVFRWSPENYDEASNPSSISGIISIDGEQVKSFDSTLELEDYYTEETIRYDISGDEADPRDLVQIEFDNYNGFDGDIHYGLQMVTYYTEKVPEEKHTYNPSFHSNVADYQYTNFIYHWSWTQEDHSLEEDETTDWVDIDSRTRYDDISDINKFEVDAGSDLGKVGFKYRYNYSINR